MDKNKDNLRISPRQPGELERIYILGLSKRDDNAGILTQIVKEISPDLIIFNSDANFPSLRDYAQRLRLPVFQCPFPPRGLVNRFLDGKFSSFKSPFVVSTYSAQELSQLVRKLNGYGLSLTLEQN